LKPWVRFSKPLSPNSTSFVSVTADDAGVDPCIDRAIIDLSLRERIQSAAVCVTFPTQLESSVEGLKALPITLGLHVDVSSGQPVSKPSKIKTLMSGARFRSPTPLAVKLGGDFESALVHFRSELGKHVNPTEVEIEVIAQLQRYQDFFGERPTFLSVHHDLDLVPKIRVAVARAASDLDGRQARLRSGQISSYMCLFAKEERIGAWCAKLNAQLCAAATGQLGPAALIVVHPSSAPPSSEFSVYRHGRVIEFKGLRAMSMRHFAGSLRFVGEGGDFCD
jgi:predicted glycoside hydrolase/deacetylase ChbG (UPF0249 family)